MSKCTNNNINISSSTNIVDDISTDIEKQLTTADDCDDTSTKSEEKFTTCEQKIEHTKTDIISSTNNDNVGQDIVEENAGSNLETSDVCANCGKEGASNTCNKCKQVKYCNAVCKKKHKTKHKRACERRQAELHDIELFKQSPQQERDCPICFLRLPSLITGSRYQSCCGKNMCSGCIHAPRYDDQGNAMDNKICPFCRTSMPASEEESIKRLQKRMDAGDAQATQIVAGYYSRGLYGLPINHMKALELWKRAVELGRADAYFNIGCMYLNGQGVSRDMKKAIHYWELGAVGGCAAARHNLGSFEYAAGNMERAIKHYMIAMEGGQNKSLEKIKDLYSKGKATKDDYTKALRSYQKYLAEVKSKQRDEAASFHEEFKYIE